MAGEWTTHTDAGFVGGLDVHGDSLWAGTSGGVLHWDLTSETCVKLTASDGLADQSVKDVMIDSDGNRWFGTIEGVQKFDGSTWTTYNTSNSPLPDNRVYAITQDLDGDMWFGTGFGCARFDGSIWNVFTDVGGGATNVAVRGIDVDSRNRIWTANNPHDYGTPGGVSMYNDTAWVRFDPETSNIGQYYLSLAVDNDDNVWAGNWTKSVFMYDGSTWTNYTSVNSGLVGNNIEAFAVEEDNTVWIANHVASASPTTGGVASFDGTTWTTYTPANSDLPDPYIYSIAALDGVVYFGTRSHGCAAYDGSTWEFFETSNEPHVNHITAIDQGSVGGNSALYFGTAYYGVAVYDGINWSSYHSMNSALGGDFVNDVHVDNDLLWIGSQYTGVWKFNGISWQNYHSGNSGLLCDIILSVDNDSQGNHWFGTSGWDGPLGQDGALAKFDGSSWTNYYLSNSGLIDDDGLHVHVDAGDTIWIGTEEGISKFDGVSSWTSYHTGNSGLVENHVQAIAFGPDNGKWFATLGGVSRFVGGTWTSWTTADGLPSNAVRDIRVSGAGNVWIATAGGVANYEEGTGWTAYTQADGVGDNDVTSVQIESEDIVWFGLDESGISVFANAATGIDASGVLPSAIRLDGNRPNPFNPTTSIEYELNRPERVVLRVYDVQGRLVRTLVNEPMVAGRHAAVWDGLNDRGHAAGSGVYFARMEAGGYTATGKMILVR